MLTVCGELCAYVARYYGFTNVLDTTHVAAIRSTISPFANIKGTVASDAERIADRFKIDAVLVMTDSRNWGRHTQIILDVFLNQYSH